MKPVQIESPWDDALILDVNNVSVSRSGKMILRDINLRLSKGEFVGLVGPNGSGKSTLLLSILGVLKLQSGTVRIFGEPPMSSKLHGKVGWVSQAAANLPRDIKITVRELVQLGAVNALNMIGWISLFRWVRSYFTVDKRREKVNEAIKLVGLEDVKNTDIGRLSGGQRQRAVIARALASEAEIIILDEPLVGIDRDSRNSLLKLLDDLCHDEGKTILMVSHDLAAIRQTAHRMIYLEESIQFDGHTEEFPDLDTLAGLRGIGNVHYEPNAKEDE